MLSYFELLLNGLPELKYLGLDRLRELAVVPMKVPQKPGQRLWKRNNRSSQAEPPAGFTGSVHTRADQNHLKGEHTLS